MKDSTKNNAEGKVLEIKGKMKEKLGEATGDVKLKAHGVADQLVGKAKQVVGKAEETLGE
ncbi:MAG: CsbD family protein [Gemmatimonadetes bacterium]|nr:CsbD family protein [Gemmatimonadota bacterium]